MKKLLLAIFIFFLSINAGFAYDLNKMTDSSKVMAALRVLEQNNQNDVLTRIEKNKTKIMFYDLSMIDFSYAKHYAISSTDEYGDNYILINSSLISSPKEALACLIAHESVHQLSRATFDEEVLATTTEAKTWMLLKDKVSGNYENDKLVKRLNKLVAMEETGSQMIANSISSNSFYQKQLVR